MASPAGNSSVSGTGSEGDLMDQRKRKRMESNRESARRSRLRKQKHLDDLTAEAAELRKENAQMSRAVDLTKERYIRMEAENSVLRAQMNVLTQSLDYLNGVLTSVNNQHHYGGACNLESEELHMGLSEGLFSSGGMWNSNSGGAGSSQQFPIMAAAEMMFDY